MSEWKETILGDLIGVKHGFAFPGEYIKDLPCENILLTPGNFAIGGGFKGDKFKYYYGAVPEEFILNEDDLLITMTDLSKQSDTLGYPAFVPCEDNKIFLHNQRLGKVILQDGAEIDIRYLHYLLCCQDYRHEILASATGTSIKHTSPDRIKRFQFNKPPLPEQKSIASILSSLDDKIELNRRMNETLEAMARAIFKDWFVDFGPTRAKQEGRAAYLPEHLWSLFPEAIDRETGLPIGWEEVTISQYLDVKRGGSPRPIKDYIVPVGIPWVKIADATSINSPFIFSTKEFIKPEGLRKTVKLKAGSLILSNSATPGLPRFLMLDACIHDGWLYFPKIDKFSKEYLYLLFLSIRENLVGQGNGSIFTNLKTEIIKNQRIVDPSQPIIDLFQSFVGGFFEKMLVTDNESRTLAELRDRLLPKLMSGEIRVKDAEKIVEEVL